MNLEHWRNEVDKVDESIMKLLLERADITRKIGEEKRRSGLDLQDARREAEVMQRLQSINGGRLREDLLEAAYRSIIEMCTEVQREKQA